GSYAAVLGVAGVAINWLAVRSAVSAPAPPIARRSDPERRVRWVGSKERAPKVRPADTESFEPVFFRAWLPSDDPARAVPRLIALGIAAVATYLALRFSEVRGPALLATAAFAVAA